MLIHCGSNQGQSFLMKHAPIQWLNIWKGAVISPVHRKGEKYTLYNYSTHNLCQSNDDSWIHVSQQLDNTSMIAQIFGSEPHCLQTRDKTPIRILTDNQAILTTLVLLWSNSKPEDAKNEFINDEIQYILGKNFDADEWVRSAYEQQMQLGDKPTVRGRIAETMAGDSRSIIDTLSVFFSGGIETNTEQNKVVSSTHFHPWIMDVLKDDGRTSLVETTPEWLKPKKEAPVEGEEPNQVSDDDRIIIWELLQQIKCKTLTVEDRWKSYISLFLLFDMYQNDEENGPRTRSSLKYLAKGLPVHGVLHIIAKWLNVGQTEQLAPKQLELVLADVHRLISDESFRELNMRLLFLPWLIPPLLKTCLPHHQSIWERLQLKTFNMFGMIYGNAHTISEEFLSYWKKSIKYLSQSLPRYDKTKVDPRKWVALYADCYLAHMNYIAHNIYSSHTGNATEKRFIQLVEEREADYENTRDASPTGVLLRTLAKELANQEKISEHKTLSWYLPRECLAEYIDKSAFVWYWMAYHFKKKIPGWLTPIKLQFFDFKKKTEQQKLQTMILEQLLETMEHSLTLNIDGIVSKVVAKNPVTVKQAKDALSDLIKHESKSLEWLPATMQKTLGLRRLKQDGSFTIRDAYTINSIITSGIKYIKDHHQHNVTVEDEEWKEIVATLPFLPDETQQSYVRQMIKEPISILKGPPGCGKTATLHLFNQVAKHLKWSVVYLGPTGRSVTRMTQLIPGLKALLRDSEMDVRSGAKTSISDQVCMTLDRAVYPLSSSVLSLIRPTVIVIDETSMVNSITAAKLFFLLSSGLDTDRESTKVVLVGDPEQLFPVEAGSFFEQCIKSGSVTTFSLTKIYRQSAVRLLQTCQNILNYQPSMTFPQIVLHDPNCLADCTAINGRERVKADEYKKMATADYRRSCLAIKSDVLARKFICPRTQGRLGVVEMNFMAQSVWQSVGLPLHPLQISSTANTNRTTTIPVITVQTKTGKVYTYGNSKDQLNFKDEEVDYESRRGVVKKWMSFTKKPKNGENINSAEWATLALGNATRCLDLENGEYCFLPGDPVMCQSEIRGSGLTNGDECILAGWITNQSGQHAILLDNIRNVFVTVKMGILFKQFAPSYCITAHKSQGGEYPHVFICMPWVDADETAIGSNPKYPYYRLLTKRLLYTSITRTKNICTLYGWRHAYRLCMEDRYAEERADFLSLMLKEE